MLSNLKTKAISFIAFIMFVAFSLGLVCVMQQTENVLADGIAETSNVIEFDFSEDVNLGEYFYAYKFSTANDKATKVDNIADAWEIKDGYLQSKVEGASDVATVRNNGVMLTFKEYLFQNVRVTYTYKRMYDTQKPVRPAIGVRAEGFDIFYEKSGGGIGLSNTNDGCALIYNGRGINKQDTTTKIANFNDYANEQTVVVSIIGDECRSEIINENGTNSVAEYTITEANNIYSGYGALTISSVGTNRMFSSIKIENLDANGAPAPLKKVATSMEDIEDQTIEVGETYAVNPVMGSSDECTDIRLESNDPETVMVQADGTLKGLQAGEAIVTVTVPFTDIEKTFKVTVEGEGQAEVEPTDISLSNNTITMASGYTFKISATVNPANATNKEVVFVSSNDKIFTVANDGTITAVAEGNATLTAQVVGTEIKKEIPVYVFTALTASESTLVYDFSTEEQMQDFVPYNYVEVSGTSFGYEQTDFDWDWYIDEETGELCRQEQDPIKKVSEAAILTLKDKFFENFEIVFSAKKLISQPGRAQVAFRQTTEGTYNTRDGAGAWVQGNGMATIWGEPGTVSGPYQGNEISGWSDLEYHVMKIRVVGNDITIWVDGVEREMPEMTLGEAFIRAGYVSLIGVGCQTSYDYFAITNLDENGNPAKIQSGAVTGISLNRNEAEGKVGEFIRLSYTMEPSFAANQSVSWKSSDETVATVDETGKVTLLKVGTVTITVITEDGDFTDQCVITVTESKANEVENSDGKNGGCGANVYSSVALLSFVILSLSVGMLCRTKRKDNA